MKMVMAEYRFCPHCGQKYAPGSHYITHVTCSACGRSVAFNRVSVTALLVPNLDYSALHLCKRSETMDTAPNKWSLPSGYSQHGETVRITGSRETNEEIQILVRNPECSIRIIDAQTATNKRNDVIFGLVDPRAVTVYPFEPNSEASERLLLTRCAHRARRLHMAFPMHTSVIDRFFVGEFRYAHFA